MKKWPDVLESAQEFVTFLNQEKFFDKPFVNTIDALVITDAEKGFEYAHGQEEDQGFPEWEDVSRVGIFPEGFEFHDSVFSGLGKGEYFFGIQNKDFSGVNERWHHNVKDMMIGDIEYIMQCYANNHFPPVWEKILQAYLNGGLPCGWSDFPPKGQIVVFSNE